MFTRAFLRDLLERALSTAAQSALLVLGADQIDAIAADWGTVAGFALGGAVLSVLKGVAAARAVGDNSASLDPELRTTLAKEAS
jgi:hypothetical protein